MRLLSYTFTTEELRSQVANYLSNHIPKRDACLSLQGNERLISVWCECMSEQYFVEHPEVSDVLLLTDDGAKSGVILKEWMASR